MTADNSTRPPDSAAEKVATVRQHRLPQELRSLVDTYDDAVGERDRFLWKWLHYLFPDITLSCVADRHRSRVRTAKTVASMFVVLLDDVAENQMDRVTFEEASKIPFGHQSPDPYREEVDVGVLSFAASVWDRLEELLAPAPRAEEFRGPFEFDVKQNLNAVDYSYLVNHQPEMANIGEATAYDSHNMMLFSYADVDLMFSPSFDVEEFAAVRSVVGDAQRMIRVGNWMTTWEREVHEGDFSSGVVVCALEDGVVSAGELRRAREEPDADHRDRIVEAIRDEQVEDRFLRRWRRSYERVEEQQSAVESVDVEALLDGVQTVMTYHMASRGWI